jgi:hypothetical protein
MGFFDRFFRDKEKEKDLPPGKKSHYQGDIAKTNLLQKLFEVPKERRDSGWQQQFLANVADAAFRCANPQVIKGPDDFPYFILHVPEPFQNFQAFTIRHMKDDFMLDSGYGIVINPKGNAADWVFSYGDIVNFHISGEFYSPENFQAIQKEETLTKDEQMLVSQPSEKYLPKKTRVIIRDFLKAMGIQHPKVMLVTRKINGSPIQELAFNIKPTDFPSRRHFDFTIEHLSWYLPRHYIILTFPNETDIEKSFAEL